MRTATSPRVAFAYDVPLVSDGTVTAALIALVLILLVAGAVLAFVAFPHRSRPIPGAPSRVSNAAASADELLEATLEAPAHGLLDSRERHQRAAAGFERLEQRIIGLLRRRPAARETTAPEATAPVDVRSLESAARERR